MKLIRKVILSHSGSTPTCYGTTEMNLLSRVNIEAEIADGAIVLNGKSGVLFIDVGVQVTEQELEGFVSSNFEDYENTLKRIYSVVNPTSAYTTRF